MKPVVLLFLTRGSFQDLRRLRTFPGISVTMFFFTVKPYVLYSNNLIAGVILQFLDNSETPG